MLTRLVPEQPTLRTFVWATLVSNLGNGLFIAISVVYFTRSAGLTTGQVGLGLTVAGVCGVLAGVPAGRLADRWGARHTLTMLFCVETIGVLGYTMVRSMVVFVPLACLVTFVDQAALTARSALIAVALPPDTRVYGRSVLRVVSNIGIGAGSAVAAIALQYDTLAVYQVMMVVDAATFLGAALLLMRLPVATATTPPPAEQTTGPTEAPRRRPRPRLPHVDRTYILMAALNGVLAVQVGVLEVGVPLWIVQSADAPRFVISVLMAVNTLMVIFLQVRTGRGVRTPPQGARACLHSGALLAVACLLFGLAHGISRPLAVTILLVGVVVFTFGEILSSAGGWALSFGLVNPKNSGEYLGVFNSGIAAGRLLSPVLITSTAIRFGLTGWLVLAVMFLVAGAGIAAVRLK
ncbi:MFS transporter [Streptomyces sp. FXJ1.172]|uniref:MFS transporter n=1 Tax=Streptomyces sp. FXJ1.172 TaxID=710705 RepID=UPI000A7947C9|nr:MFS transporter [Streptomyces sp. FXJ1.172]WEO93668.1 MFS transporter [Streptomyces sp. FXJ1.172]